MKDYNEKNKEKHKVRDKIYREKHKQRYKEQSKKYREDHKEEIREKKKEKIMCECGLIVNKQGLYIHLKTKKHKEHLEFNENDNDKFKCECGSILSKKCRLKRHINSKPHQAYLASLS